MKVVLATKNSGKLQELQQLASGGLCVDFVLAPPSFAPVETGSTFLANAVIKAQAAAKQTHLHALADDSGLEVNALHGQPGVHSARYCEGSDADRRAKLLLELSSTGTAERGAAFVCAMALCSPSGEVLATAEARWHGLVVDTERGKNGFGYDPIFYLEGLGRTAAELSSEQKNEISHRAQAWREIKPHIEQICSARISD